MGKINQKTETGFMTVFQLRKKAEEMQIPFNEAAFCRFRFVREQMFVESAAIDQFEGLPIDFESWIGIYNYILFANVLDRFLNLAKEQRALLMEFSRKPSAGMITDDMKERARQYPVTQLIDFQRGRAVAWCHPDKNPSLYYAPRINKAVCPVCNQYFDSISVLMQRDSLTFAEAVKQLAA